MASRAEKLTDVLEKEKSSLPEFNGFGGLNDVSGYEAAIVYLRTGDKPSDYMDNDILYACVDDFEMMCSDYEIE